VRPSFVLDGVKIVGIDHVQLAAPAGCEEAARRFFGGLLGLAEVEKPAALRPRSGVWFALGAGRQQLHVGVEEAHAPAHRAHPAFLVQDLDELAAKLEAGGAIVAWDGSLPGVRRFYTADPWGNRLELVAAE
jgi:catechol 2,3-dioxygenase-like lactoylglutathione lyase family enzyme